MKRNAQKAWSVVLAASVGLGAAAVPGVAGTGIVRAGEKSRGTLLRTETVRTKAVNTGKAETVRKEEITLKNLKQVTEKIRNYPVAQGKAYVDVNNSPLLVSGLIGEIYIHPKSTPKEQKAQTAMTRRVGEIARYAYQKLTPSEREAIPPIPEGLGYEYPGAGGADYFVSTGDPSRDNPLNTAPTKKKEILVVSFGTSYTDSRTAAIGGIERALQAAYPDYDVRRAFTSQVIINHILARDEEEILTVREALEEARAAGVTDLIVQPTTLMHGTEYDLMVQNVKANQGKMRVSFAEPLLGSAADSDEVTNADKKSVAKAVAGAAAKDLGASDIQSVPKDTAVVLLGHGTSHRAASAYNQMQYTVKELGYSNVFIGTVEGEPEETEVNAVVKKVKEAGYRNVVLRPLMVVAGDHANNDMAGTEEDSWSSRFQSAGLTVTNQIAGLGEIPAVQQLYVSHTKAAVRQAEALQEQIRKVQKMRVLSFSGKAKKNRRIRLSWKKLSGLDSYEVQMAKTKNGKYTRIGRTKKIPFTTKAYRSGQRLYFRVRGVKQVDGRAVYTGWSKKLTVRVK